MNNWPRIIQDWLFPPTCILCGDPGMNGRDLCEACDQSLPHNQPACPRCALPLPSESAEPCGECQKHPPAFDGSFALFHYEEPARHLITSLKFQSRYACAKLLGEMLADALTHQKNRPELIIPVPLHRSRYRHRNFNQTLEIARTVSRHLQIPLDYQSCVRIRRTLPQTDLKGKDRRRNVRKAFALSRPIHAGHVAILDDVMTTGATANELAQVLRQAGVGYIEVWACARAGGKL